MEAGIAGMKIMGTMVSSAFVAVIIDATTNVPLIWLVGSAAALAGGVWKLASLLTKIDDRLTALEKRNEQKDKNDPSGSAHD